MYFETFFPTKICTSEGQQKGYFPLRKLLQHERILERLSHPHG